MLQAFQSHLWQWVTPLPSKTLDGFTDEVMQHIARPTAIETTPDHIISTSLWSSFRHRFIFVGMFMVLSCFALVRQAFIDEMFILHQMKPSIVTRDGSIVSEAQFRGHKAAINVVKDRDGMVIIWLDVPAHKTKQERRSGLCSYRCHA